LTSTIARNLLKLGCGKDIQFETIHPFLDGNGRIGRLLITYLYGAPTITVNKAMDLLAIKYVPANGLIATLADMEILEEVTGYQRNRIFLLRRYIDIFRDENSI
jgi:hypothetical protein